MIHKKVFPGTVAEVEPRVLKALQDEGFGLLSRLAFDEILREKRGTEMAPYVRLGVCNPALAEAALSSTPEIGVVLPCAVILRQTGNGVEAFYLDPETAFRQVAGGELELAREVARRLDRALGKVEVAA